MASGYIKLHRSIQDNPKWLAEAFSRQQAWIDLLLLANHKPTVVYIAGHRIDVQRGEVAWSAVNLAKRWRWSKSKFWRFMDELERELKTSHHNLVVTTVISITNYEQYLCDDTPNESPQTSNESPNESPIRNENESPRINHKQISSNVLQSEETSNESPNESPKRNENESPQPFTTPPSPSFPSPIPPVSPSLSPCIPSYIPSYSPSPLSNTSSSPRAECQTFQLISEEVKPAKLTWSPSSGWMGIQSKDIDAWKLAYPACDIKRELAKMDEWLKSNPRRSVKKLYRRFINNWLSRSQERGGDHTANWTNKTPSRAIQTFSTGIVDDGRGSFWWRKYLVKLYEPLGQAKIDEFMAVKYFKDLPLSVQQDCNQEYAKERDDLKY